MDSAAVETALLMLVAALPYSQLVLVPILMRSSGNEEEPKRDENWVPLDDPRRDPGWCHSHNKPMSEEEDD